MANLQSPLVDSHGPADAARSEEPPLYEKRRQIYPQAVSGKFRQAKWIILVVTLGIYYALPFVRWDRGPNAPSQAILVDFPGRRFYFFFIEIWPQEVYYFTGLLVLAALILFLTNAIAGRMWCGYLCPQTVWTDLFYAVERWVEGDRRERMLNDQKRPTARTIARKALKHAIWLAIAWWTGGAWVLYFADAPTLVRDLATLQAPATAWVWIGILTSTTYVLAGFMREQVCVYMCPWPRIQAALTDEYALNVTYRYDRGEPRGSYKKIEALRAQNQPGGDCIDCYQCVVVCPTGVDIRNGLQLDCIQCGLCIDACNAVMDKVDRPRGLIAYDTEMNVRRRMAGKSDIIRIIRPRTILYAVLIVIVAGLMLTTLATRSDFGFSVIHDRNPLFVRLTDGSLRNAYTVRIANKTLEPRRFALAVDGLPDARVELVAIDQQDNAAQPEVTVGPDQTREVRALVTSHTTPAPGIALGITFILTDLADGTRVQTADHFRGP